MAPRNITTVETVCKKCSKEVKNSVTCCICLNTYHPSCILKIDGIYVEKGKVFCCNDITSKKCDCAKKDKEIQELKTRLLKLNEISFENSISQQSIIDEDRETLCEYKGDENSGEEPAVPSHNTEVENLEIEYLNRLLLEKSNMIDELRDKIDFLKKYISLQEKIEGKQSTMLTSVGEIPKFRHNFTLPTCDRGSVQKIPDDKINEKETADRSSERPVVNKTKEVNKHDLHKPNQMKNRNNSASPKIKEVRGTRPKTNI